MRHIRHMCRIVTAAGIVALSLVMASCGQSTATDAQPEFTGPYAAEFRKNYDETDNALVKGILKDSKITDAEFEEFKSSYSSCMKEQGLVWDYTDTGETTGSATGADVSAEELHRATDVCNPKTGYMQLMPLYDSLHSNPDNLAPDELEKRALACLVKHGYAPQDMTLQEYQDINRDNDRFMATFGKYMDSTSPDYQQFYACMQDPVNAG